METIKTTLHYYYFDVSNEKQKIEYDDLKKQTLSKLGFPVWTMDGRFNTYCEAEKKQDAFMEKVSNANGHIIELETKHLFDNQWNTKEPSLRLFNWGEMVYANSRIKRGYWLEQTKEMAEILRNTHKCGYCGAQEPAAKGYTFCPHCLGSEYLEKKQLHLTRMVSVIDTSKPRAPLSEAEAANLITEWINAQFHGKTERDKLRIANQRAEIAKDLERTVSKAKIEHDGKLWLLDNCLKIENVIYYDHLKKWTFGWRKKLDKDEVFHILKIVKNFPYSYEILCDDGQIIKGNV